MRIISFIVFVIAVILLISVFMYSDGLFSGFTGDGFRGFSRALFNFTQAIALPIILAMLGMIGLALGGRRRQ